MKKLSLLTAFICYFSLKGFSQTAPSEVVDSTNIDLHGAFEQVQVQAEFPGGMNGWVTYIQKNLNGDLPATNGAPPGKYEVRVRFIVNADGSISNIVPLTNCGYGMEKEVVRIIQNGPKWNPALQDGKFVRAYRIQPVIFMVEN